MLCRGFKKKTEFQMLNRQFGLESGSELKYGAEL